MTRRPRTRATSATLLTLATLSTAACGQLNRSASLNQPAHTTSAAAVEPTLQAQLAKLGIPSAKVLCSKKLIVNVGTTNTCSLTGAQASLLTFTFANSKGQINLSSVKPR